MTIQGKSLHLPVESAQTAFVALAHLEHLHLQCLPYVCDAVLASEAAQGTPRISIYGTSAFRCSTFIDHLRGDLVLRCTRSGSDIVTTFRSIESGLERTLIASLAHFTAVHNPTPGIVKFCPEYSYSVSILGMIAVANRVTQLEVSADSWHIFSDALLHLPNCSKLIFVLNDRRPLTRYMAAAPVLPCPALECVVLTATCQRLTLKVAELASLLTSLLQLSRSASLILNNVDLDGDRSLLCEIVDMRGILSD